MQKSAGTDWLWLRHAPTVSSGGFCGWTDAPARIVPEERYGEIAARLPASPHVFVSPLRRAAQTLAGLRKAGLSPMECVTSDLLREQNFGDLEDSPYDGVTLPDDAEGLANWRPPNGESFVDVIARVAAFLCRADIPCDAPCLVVAHAGVIRAALAIASGASPAQAVGVPVAPLSLTALSQGADQSWRILYTNRIFGDPHAATG